MASSKLGWALLVALLAIIVASRWNPGMKFTTNLLSLFVNVLQLVRGDMADLLETDIAGIANRREKYNSGIKAMSGSIPFDGLIFNISTPFPPELPVLPNDGDGVEVRVYVPALQSVEELGGLVVYYHGGGWVIGSLDTHDTTIRFMAAHTKCVIASVNYRLSPEHKFPIPVQDSIDATKTLIARAKAGQIPNVAKLSKFAVMGDSAGGNIAAVVAQQLTLQGIPLQLQVLIYPVTDYIANFPSWVENANAPVLQARGMTWFWHRYLPAPYQQHGASPMASPLKQTDKALLSRLPPAIVLTAHYDILRDEGEAYAELLKMSGVRVKLTRAPDQPHGFFRASAAPEVLRETASDIVSALLV